ncbi:MAG TPA: HEAT repeat domain-containing protein [Terriglobales bacterium]|nr:HEAT repeat domain-containing protein [Terriglobales bacterium]
MPSGFEALFSTHTAMMALVALAASVLTIGLLLGFIVGRRWLRGRYFRHRDRRVMAIRSDWDGIVGGRIPPQEWKRDALTAEVVETLLLDSLEVATAAELPPLLKCLQRSGLLDQRILEARMLKGWRRRAALVSLGRTRALEALPALIEALNSKDGETIIAAVRGINRVARPQAAEALLRKLAGSGLKVPLAVLKNALIQCARESPAVLLPYLERFQGEMREVLARVLAELVDSCDLPVLLAISADPLAEVRASAARGLARLSPDEALAPLTALAADPEWFVRLRAIVALGALHNPAAIPALVRGLCDRNQLVRQRAAWSLLRFETMLTSILAQVVATRDDYGLQALVSELDSGGRYEAVLDEVEHSARLDAARLTAAIQEARRKLGLAGTAAPQVVAS